MACQSWHKRKSLANIQIACFTVTRNYLQIWYGNLSFVSVIGIVDEQEMILIILIPCQIGIYVIFIDYFDNVLRFSLM
jgi:hypothetical protein